MLPNRNHTPPQLCHPAEQVAVSADADKVQRIGQAEADRIRVKGEAEAEVVKLKGEAEAATINAKVGPYFNSCLKRAACCMLRACCVS